MNDKKPLVKNAANESEIRYAEQKQKLNQESADNDLKFILSTDQGRRFVWSLFDMCGVFKSSFRQSSEIYFLEGQRNIGLKLIADVMRVDPESYLKMHKQSKGDN